MSEKQDITGKVITAIALGGIVSLVAPSLYIVALVMIGSAESSALTIKGLAFISFLIFVIVFVGTLVTLLRKGR